MAVQFPPVIKGGPKSPCGKVCPNRCQGCASTCDKWKAYTKERAEWRHEKFVENQGTPIRKRPHYKPNSR